MKPVIIIAIAFVLLSSTIIPVMGQTYTREQVESVWSDSIKAANDNDAARKAKMEGEAYLSGMEVKAYYRGVYGGYAEYYQVYPDRLTVPCQIESEELADYEKIIQGQIKYYEKWEIDGDLTKFQPNLEILTTARDQCLNIVPEIETVTEIVSEIVSETMTVKEIVCGKGTIDVNGQCIVDPNYKKSAFSGGGCLIATATYGSELAPQVQQLRELRDNSLLQTESGTQFMESFNGFYYSFSPIIADYERENPIFKEMVKVAITPMVSSLSILNYVDMDSESEVLGYGISLIILNGLMYVGIPASVIVVVRRF